MKARAVVGVFVVACLAVAAVLWLGPVCRENQATREAIERLNSTLGRQAQEIERLNQELRALRTDYRAIERVAREKFGMCRPDEEIYHFETPAGNAQTEAEEGAAGTGAKGTGTAAP
jgi:cell division protein FtsB